MLVCSWAWSVEHSEANESVFWAAYCRNSVDGQWYAYDDSSVEPVPEGEVCTRGAYILFYQRRDAIPSWSASCSLQGERSSLHLCLNSIHTTSKGKQAESLQENTRICYCHFSLSGVQSFYGFHKIYTKNIGLKFILHLLECLPFRIQYWLHLQFVFVFFTYFDFKFLLYFLKAPFYRTQKYCYVFLYYLYV